MLLTITCTQSPATDLSYLLHKHPDRVQSFDLAFGQAHVFYPEAGDERCTAALLLDVDPIGMVRGRQGPAVMQSLENYVNDRPYVASSFLSVAIAQVYGSALSSKSRERTELAATPLPLQARLAVVPSKGGEDFLRRLFEPLGYTVEVTPHALDATFPQWGRSLHYTVTLTAHCTLSDLLAHLYVLIPVLDDEKHYWVGDDEVEKLLRRGEGWLATHPEREIIAHRYLRHNPTLTSAALARLLEAEGADPDAEEEAHAAEEETLEARVSLHSQRLQTVLATLKQAGARSVLDLGCGEGRLLALLLAEPQFERILGLDVSYRSLAIARRRLRLDRLPQAQQDRITLLQGALTYRDRRLDGYDAAAVVEVIEHLDPARLVAFEAMLFGHARPAMVVLTTPNVEYNVTFPNLPDGRFRHRDHRFEWTRAEFAHWASDVAGRHGYTVRFEGIGPEDPAAGTPSQMGIFRRASL